MRFLLAVIWYCTFSSFFVFVLFSISTILPEYSFYRTRVSTHQQRVEIEWWAHQQTKKHFWNGALPERYTFRWVYSVILKILFVYLSSSSISSYVYTLKYIYKTICVLVISMCVCEFIQLDAFLYLFSLLLLLLSIIWLFVFLLFCSLLYHRCLNAGLYPNNQQRPKHSYLVVMKNSKFNFTNE